MTSELIKRYMKFVLKICKQYRGGSLSQLKLTQAAAQLMDVNVSLCPLLMDVNVSLCPQLMDATLLCPQLKEVKAQAM